MKESSLDGLYPPGFDWAKGHGEEELDEGGYVVGVIGTVGLVDGWWLL